MRNRRGFVGVKGREELLLGSQLCGGAARCEGGMGRKLGE